MGGGPTGADQGIKATSADSTAVRGISTDVIWEHDEAGEDVTEIAAAFDLTPDNVRWALAYETSLRSTAA